jgi:hypothetical protein
MAVIVLSHRGMVAAAGRFLILGNVSVAGGIGLGEEAGDILL